MSIRKLVDKRRPRRGAAGGFSTLEVIIATGLLTMVVGTVATLLNNVQKGQVAEQDASEVQQNQRYAMDTILRAVRGAGNDPEGLGYTRLYLDPNSDGAHNDLRVVSDCNPADGDTNDPYENVLFTLSNNVLSVMDASTGTTTELAQNISAILYEYFDANGNATTVGNDVFKVRVTLTGITTHNDPHTGQPRTITLTDEATIRWLSGH